MFAHRAPHYLRQGGEVSDADKCTKNGWKVGDLLEGDEGFGPTLIEITAIGDEKILARAIKHNGHPVPSYESCWKLDYRNWKRVGRNRP